MSIFNKSPEEKEKEALKKENFIKQKYNEFLSGNSYIAITLPIPRKGSSYADVYVAEQVFGRGLMSTMVALDSGSETTNENLYLYRDCATCKDLTFYYEDISRVEEHGKVFLCRMKNGQSMRLEISSHHLHEWKNQAIYEAFYRFLRDKLDSKLYCPGCNHEINKNSKFCSNCGYNLENQVHFCPNCGIKVEPDSKFCSNCGYKL